MLWLSEGVKAASIIAHSTAVTFGFNSKKRDTDESSHCETVFETSNISALDAENTMSLLKF